MNWYCERKDKYCSFAEGENGICRLNYDCTAPDVKTNTYYINIYLFKDGKCIDSSETMYIKMPETRAENLLLFLKNLNDNNRDVKIEMDMV